MKYLPEHYDPAAWSPVKARARAMATRFRAELLGLASVCLDQQRMIRTRAYLLRGWSRSMASDTFSMMTNALPILPVPRMMLPMLHKTQLVDMWGVPLGDVAAHVLGNPDVDPNLYHMLLGKPTGVVVRPTAMVEFEVPYGRAIEIYRELGSLITEAKEGDMAPVARDVAESVYSRENRGQTLPDRAHLEYSHYAEVEVEDG